MDSSVTSPAQGRDSQHSRHFVEVILRIAPWKSTQRMIVRSKAQTPSDPTMAALSRIQKKRKLNRSSTTRGGKQHVATWNALIVTWRGPTYRESGIMPHPVFQALANRCSTWHAAFRSKRARVVANESTALDRCDAARWLCAAPYSEEQKIRALLLRRTRSSSYPLRHLIAQYWAVNNKSVSLVAPSSIARPLHGNFAKEKHMTDTKGKTLKLRQQGVNGEILLDEKAVELRASGVGKSLDRHNAEMVGEQRRRVNHPHDGGS